MTVVGINLYKITAERDPNFSGKVSIKNNATIKDVQKTDLFLGKTKQEAVKFMFEFSSKYEPTLGNIILSGDCVFVEDAKVIKDILADWKKDKRVKTEIMADVLNNILQRCNIEALVLSKEINLPPPLQLPQVETKQPEAAEKGK